jgi:hypothetical protein
LATDTKILIPSGKPRYFPDADEVGPFGPAFLRLMFAYAEVERRVADLQNEITGERFGEQNCWGARERPKRMRRLINDNRERLNSILPPKDVEKLVALLKQAIRPCELRNLLAHGHWWELDPNTETILVRRARGDGKRHVAVTVADINHAASELIEIEVELYKLQPCWPLTDEERRLLDS